MKTFQSYNHSYVSDTNLAIRQLDTSTFKDSLFSFFHPLKSCKAINILIAVLHTQYCWRLSGASPTAKSNLFLTGENEREQSLSILPIYMVNILMLLMRNCSWAREKLYVRLCTFVDSHTNTHTRRLFIKQFLVIVKTNDPIFLAINQTH